MNIILLIIAVCYLCNAVRLKNLYVNYYNGFDSDNIGARLGHFLGTFLAFCIEGICWYYIIKNIIQFY